MSDIVNNQQTTQASAPPLTSSQFESIKASLQLSLINSYQQFIYAIVNLPGNRDMQKIAFQYLDNGYLWLRQMIETMPLPVAPPPPVQPEVKQPEVTEILDAA